MDCSPQKSAHSCSKNFSPEKGEAAPAASPSGWNQICVSLHSEAAAKEDTSHVLVTLRDTRTDFVAAAALANDQTVAEAAAGFVKQMVCLLGLCPVLVKDNMLLRTVAASLTDLPWPVAVHEWQPSEEESTSNQQLEADVATLTKDRAWPARLNAWLWQRNVATGALAILLGQQSLSSVATVTSRSGRRIKEPQRFHQTSHGQDEDEDDVDHAGSFGQKRRRRKKKKVSKGYDALARKNKIKERKTTEINSNKDPVEGEAEVMDTAVASALQERTVNAVAALLAATDSERVKRGRYGKYSAELRDEIAEMAESEGVAAAAAHYTDQLGFKVNASTVRNFLKAYQVIPGEQRLKIGRSADQHGAERAAQHFGVSSSAAARCLANLRRRQRLSSKEGSSTTASAAPVIDRVMEAPKHAAQVVPVDLGQQASTSSSAVILDLASGARRNRGNETSVASTIPCDPGHAGLVNLSEAAAASRPLAVPAKKEKKRPQPRKIRAGIRGHYANYEPALRGAIGRYSLTHTNQETVAHFAATLGIQLPESTVRGLRDKFLDRCEANKDNKEALNDVNEGQKSLSDVQKAVKDDDEVAMDFGPRGRPVRLGRYDPLVLKCVRQLVDSGRKLTSFLVVAAAKQVLDDHCPSLLLENGGSVDLNQTWAKSFMRRAKKWMKESSELPPGEQQQG